MISILQAMTANNTDNLMIRDGKIYLVMTIVSIILVGLFIYVASIDKKISQLESSSTRPSRSNEIDGKDYFFISC